MHLINRRNERFLLWIHLMVLAAAAALIKPSGSANEEPPSVSESGRRRVLHAEYSRGSLLCVHLVRGTGGVSKCDILGAVMVPGTNVS